MAKNKTTETNASVHKFLNSLTDERKRKDSFTIVEIMKDQSGLEPRMWGPSIVGFGRYHYKYESGHEGDSPLIGFSPRKNALTLYLSQNFEGREELLKKFGKHKTSLACIYLKTIEDIDIGILKEMVSRSLKHTREHLASSIS
jgi:Domain of unknown function (DU1801)